MTSHERELKNVISELKAANQTIDLLHEELRRYQETLADAIADRNRYKSENIEARELVLNIQRQIQEKVERALEHEKAKFKEKLEKVEQLTQDLENEKENNRNLNELLNEKEAIINKYKQKFREIAQENPDNYELAEKIQDIENFREERIINIKQLQKLAAQNQTLCNQMEDILAENRLLRNLAQVPENYGFNLEEIKLAERQKIEDYKAQVRYREKEIEELEEERARLRYMLRQMSTLFSNKPGERYKDLTPDQLYLIDQYAMNLKEGINEVPLNDKSRELQREVDKLKGQIEILENQNFGSFEAYFDKFRDKLPSQGPSSAAIDSLKKSEEEIKQYIMKLMEAMSSNANNNIPRDSRPMPSQPMNSILSMPPTPIPGPFGNWGDIRDGFSYRFNTKISVDTSGMYTETGFDQIGAKYEIAFLQLHNLECLKLLHLKETEYQALVNESKELKEEIRRCLLVEDELFKRFYEEKQNFNEKIKDLTKKNEALVEELAEAGAKLKTFENSFNDIISKDASSIETRLAHHAKRVALLDVNLIRLSRKYDCLLEEEKQLREAYFKAETNNAEKQEYLTEKLFTLIEWRTKASKQLEILLEFQKNSFPADERENMITKLGLVNSRYSDILLKEAEYIKKIAKKESAERELFEKKEENRGLENEIVEIELELEVMKRRLEQLDPFFKKYMSVFQQIVDVIKEQKISPLAVFKMFDGNDDGKISKNEFAAALRNMKVVLTQEEIEILFLFIDLDGTGNIEYKEFLRKLRRSGVQIRKKEDELIFQIYKAITEVGLTLEQAFEAFDRNGDNMISKKDMMDTFVAMGRVVENESVDYIFKVADVSGDGLINFDEFYRLFETIVKDAKLENKRQNKMELDWKMQIMLKIDEVIHSQNLQLLDAFNMIDNNGDQKVSFNEFHEMFKQMNVPIPAPELKSLFDVIDISHNEEISYNELLSYMRECHRESERIKRLKFLTERTDNLRNESALSSKEKDMEEIKSSSNANDLNRFQMKITLLEIREKTSNQKIESLLHQLRNNEDTIAEINGNNKDLQTQLLKTIELYYNEQEKNLELQKKANGSIPKKEADVLKLEYDRITIENAALRAANNTFRNLYQAALHQTSVLRLTLEKYRSEVSTFKQIIKDLQGAGDKEAMIGKLYYSLMVSKWKESEVNKKYDEVFTEFRKVTISLQSFEEKLDAKDDEIYELHAIYREKILDNEQNIKELRLKVIPTITVSRIEGLAHTVKELSAMKTDLEIANKRLRDTNYELFLKADAYETEKTVLEALEKKLKHDNSDDLSQQLIEMSERMREYKLGELKAKRECAALSEKEEYYQRMARQNLENIKTLEQDLAEWDLKFAKREEFWHKRYNEQIKIVFGKANAGKSEEAEQGNMKKTLEMYKKKGANERKNEKLLEDFSQKSTELNVITKKLEENERKVEELSQRNKELEEILSRKENDLTAVNQITGHIKTEENERLAMAAQKTIQTLQAIISDKDEENQRKDQYIEKLKQQFYLQKENDAQEIRELYEQLRVQNLQFLQSQKLDQKSTVFSSKPQQQSNLLPDVHRLMNEKDQKIEDLSTQLDAEKQSKRQKDAEITRLLRENEEFQRDLYVEKEKNSAEKFKKEVDTLNKLIKHKDKEIKGFKDAISQLKAEFFKTCDEKMESDKKYESLHNKLLAQSGNNSQIETKLRLATRKIEEVNEKIRLADRQIEEMKVKEIEWKEKFSNLKQEKDRLQDLLDKTSREKPRKKEKTEDFVTVEEKNIGEFFKPKKEFVEERKGFSSEEDEQKSRELKELQRQLSLLKQEKAPHLVDNNGFLQKEGSLGFKDVRQLLDCVKEWLMINNNLDVFAGLKSNDKKKSGVLASETFYSELKLNGICLKPRDQALLDKEIKDSKGNVNYIEFFFMVKGLKCAEIITKKEEVVAKERKSILKDKTILTSVEKNAVDTLKNTVAELKKEKESLEKQLSNWKENAINAQNQLKTLQNKFPMEYNQQQSASYSEASPQNVLAIQDYKDKIFKLEDKLQGLQKVLTVDKENEIKTIVEEKRKIENDLKTSRLENAKLKSQMEMFLSKRLNEQEINEEIEAGKDLIISNLKAKIDESRENENTLKRKLTEAESKIIELLFVKENFDINLERYQRRINELEDVRAFYEEGGKSKVIKPSAIKKEAFKTLKKK